MSSALNNNLAEIKQFIVDNNIVGTSAGVCIALATKDGIQSFVGDIVIPAIVMLLHTLHIDGLAKYLPVKGTAKLNITDFIKQFITFILIIVISFVFVKFAFGYLLGVTNAKKDATNPQSKSSDVSNVAAAIHKDSFANF
jgi:large-conductance mechanosensitive channel